MARVAGVDGVDGQMPGAALQHAVDQAVGHVLVGLSADGDDLPSLNRAMISSAVLTLLSSISFSFAGRGFQEAGERQADDGQHRGDQGDGARRRARPSGQVEDECGRRAGFLHEHRPMAAG